MPFCVQRQTYFYFGKWALMWHKNRHSFILLLQRNETKQRSSFGTQLHLRYSSLCTHWSKIKVYFHSSLWKQKKGSWIKYFGQTDPNTSLTIYYHLAYIVCSYLWYRNVLDFNVFKCLILRINMHKENVCNHKCLIRKTYTRSKCSHILAHRIYMNGKCTINSLLLSEHLSLEVIIWIDSSLSMLLLWIPFIISFHCSDQL